MDKLNAKKLFIGVVMLTVVSVQQLKAQITVGSEDAPNADAILELKQTGSADKGLLLPRVVLTQTTNAAPMTAHVAGMTVYNTATANDVTPGYYYNNGTKWVRLLAESENSTPQIFYMPPILLATDTADPTFVGSSFKVNLFDEYAKQFGLTNAASSIKSVGAGNLPLLTSDRLEYYVTYFDSNIIDFISIDASGDLTYILKPASATYKFSNKSFVNIVLRVK